jgi:ABC-type multidrug transport system fused ATPase/permease subunit
VAYVPQSPFIIHGTIRENILFGLPYDEHRYEQCIRATCLDADLRAFAGGDATELGDNGVNLSGGQRQCLSIARALYSRADVFLLDDPLSALDSKVGRRVFEQAVKRAMKKTGKTVVLATNQLYFVQSADQVMGR